MAMEEVTDTNRNTDTDGADTDDDDDLIKDLAEDLIGDHPVFQSRGTKPQEPAAVQIAPALDRLGHFGNGMGMPVIESLAAK
ncbi:hypothetical protein BG000_001487 [Podila horticola]|nr:hypothetical protein BG000_001487 [Podila horticola]